MKLFTKTLLLALLSAIGSSIAYCSGPGLTPPPSKNPDSVQRDGPGTLPTWPNKINGTNTKYCEGGEPVSGPQTSNHPNMNATNREGGGPQPTWPN